MIRIINVRKLHTPEQRAAVVYVGRAFAGWPAHPLGNPFRPKPRYFDTDTNGENQGEHARAIQSCLHQYRKWLEALPADKLRIELAELWKATEQGRKPLGCWCVDAVIGDITPICCHAQIIGLMLAETYVMKETVAKEPTS